MSNNLQSIDYKHLNNIANGDEDFKKELIGIFLEQIPEFVNNMRQFFIEKNHEKLAKEAHTAKSSALIFGMTNTGKLLKDIELSAEKKNLKDIETTLKQAIIELNQAEAELISVLKEE